MNEQSNTQQGLIQVLANETLTSKEGYLAKIINSSGTPKAALPDAIDDICMFVIEEGAASGSYVTLRPLISGEQVRIKSNGVIAIGARVKMETPDGTNDGKIVTIGTAGGRVFSLGIAEEAIADEQLALIRVDPVMEFAGGKFLGTLAADPSAPVEGDVWYNTTDHALKFQDNVGTNVAAHV